MDKGSPILQPRADDSLLMICCTSKKEIDSTEVCGKENCFQKQKKRKATPTDESPNKKFSVRYSSEIYMEDFAKYLRKFQNPKKKKEILDILRKRGIQEELRTMNENYKYDINKKLVEFIMIEDENCSKHLEINWEMVEDSIIKVERKILDEILEMENKKQRKICFSG